MRREFFAGCSRYFVARYCPWAAKVAKVCGGYIAFESLDDYQIWKKQR